MIPTEAEDMLVAYPCLPQELVGLVVLAVMVLLARDGLRAVSMLFPS